MASSAWFVTKARFVGAVGTGLTAALLAAPALAAPENPATDWFHDAGYGVFVHYLDGIQNDADQVQSLGRATDWNACVREFDCERFADHMLEAGAGYVVFTMHQRTRHLIAPNATFDRLTGYAPGEACSTRDLVEDLYQALHARNIKLMLYWTGDGPREDAQAAAALGWGEPVTVDYVANWTAVLREYSERYGDKVAGWWVDGCYPWIGYDDERLGMMATAAKAGNPDTIVALNVGVQDKVRAYTRHEDYTTGEQNAFHDRPLTRWIDGEQWHILSYLGNWWGAPGVRYGKVELAQYIRDVNACGGVVTVDVLLYRDGSLDRSQLEVLRELRPRIAALKDRGPIPPGNLAFGKPARLLSLDGSHELEVNSGVHFPRLGVDGDPGTVALAGGEWPWTYQVDLLGVFAVRGAKVTFGAGYATSFRISLSVDGQRWTDVCLVENHDGSPYECAFDATEAEYVRVSALKPDGPDQPGAQMSVAELEVYK